jgi:hypothetical protein
VRRSIKGRATPSPPRSTRAPTMPIPSSTPSTAAWRHTSRVSRTGTTSWFSSPIPISSSTSSRPAGPASSAPGRGATMRAEWETSCSRPSR